MKIVYFGSDAFLSCFQYFIERHQVMALYTYHNDEDYFNEYAVKQLAERYGIPLHYEAISPEESTRLFTEEGCELFFAAEYNRIIPIPEHLTCFRGVNVHSSLLPQGRSYYPIEAAMERGLSRTGLTIHRLEPQLDQGAILLRRSFDITAEMDSVDIYLRCAELARDMLEQLMSDFDRCWAAARQQNEKLPYWKRPPEDLLTLRHDMLRSEALSAFRSYNSMTQVNIGGNLYYVTGMTAGEHHPVQERFISPSLALYPVQDGHLRLHLRLVEVTQ